MSRILIFRPDNVGDIVLFSGAMRHIRILYPGAHITLAVQHHIKSLVELCPYVNKVISVEEMNWWHHVQKTTGLRNGRLSWLIDRANRAYNALFFDQIIYPVKSPQIHHLRMLKDIGVKKIIGIVGCPINEPDMGYPAGLNPETLLSEYLDVSNECPWRHELNTNLDFLKSLGCDLQTVSEIQPEFWFSNDEDAIRYENRSGQKVIGLFPGASLEYRCWNPDHYAEFFRLITTPHYYVIFGSQKDNCIARRVESEIVKANPENTVLNLVGKTSLRELVIGISSCDLFIGMETAALHMAISRNVPSIGICGGGHFGRFVPWGDPEKHIFLTHQMDCFHCNWQCNRNEMECVNMVSPKEVILAAKKLLK